MYKQKIDCKCLVDGSPTLKLVSKQVLSLESEDCRQFKAVLEKAHVHSLIFRGSMSESCKQPESPAIGTLNTQSLLS